MYITVRPGALVRLVAVVAVAVTVAVIVGLFASGGPSSRSGSSSGVAPPAASLAVSLAGAADVRPVAFRVTGTAGGGLNVRGCPRAACSRVGWLPEGGSFGVVCAAAGGVVHGDATWLAGVVDGVAGYAARYYLVPAAGVDPALVPLCDRLGTAKG